MKYKPKTEIRGPWPTSEYFVQNTSAPQRRIKTDGYTRSQVLQFLKQTPGKTSKQICDSIPLSKSAINSALRLLVRLGLISATVAMSPEFRPARHYRIAA